MTDSLKFIGKSGRAYIFRIYPWPYSFEISEGAIFLFTTFLHSSFHVPLYLGITENLKIYFKSLSKIIHITKIKPTHICVCFEENESKRIFAQDDLSEIAETHVNFKVS